MKNRLSVWTLLQEKLNSSTCLLAKQQTIVASPAGKSTRTVVLFLAIFVLAFMVRVFYWGDAANTARQQSSMISRYQAQAMSLVEGNEFFFAETSEDDAKIKKLIHPPGYPIWIAVVYQLFGHEESSLIYAHIIWNALSVVMLFTLTRELLPQTVALIAAILAAISPHLAYHSIILLPDSLVALPILTAIYLLVKAYKTPHLLWIIGSGLCIGFSCWLRANSLLLFLFVGIAILFLFRERKHWQYAVAFTFSAIVAIAPVTIRNWLTYDSFIPLSLGSGITLVEGIADYDRDNRFGMPVDDADAGRKDRQWHGRSDYVTLWRPDGIARDRYRFQRGLDVIKENKFWFLSVMARRAVSMLRYNDNWQWGWPADTAKVPVILAQAPFGHDPKVSENHSAVWAVNADNLYTEGKSLQNIAVSLNSETDTIEIKSNETTTGELFASPAISVKRNTDYILQIEAKLQHKPVTLLITNEQRDISFAALPLDNTEEETPIVRIPFASNNADALRLIVLGDGAPQAAVNLGKAELLEIGATPYRWATHLRGLIRRVQKDLFKSECMITLIVIGIALLAVCKQWRTLAFLLIVPAYYLSVQSIFHTEYRYILPLHYFLFAIASVSIYAIGTVLLHWLKKGAAGLFNARHFPL